MYKNNLAILFGNVFFKIGGYIYKFLMVYLLNNYAYGILTIISPFQNILQTLAAGGLPPTISKYVSEYNATNQKENSYTYDQKRHNYQSNGMTCMEQI